MKVTLLISSIQWFLIFGAIAETFGEKADKSDKHFDDCLALQNWAKFQILKIDFYFLINSLCPKFLHMQIWD
jgi:hypothetical protein